VRQNVTGSLSRTFVLSIPENKALPVRSLVFVLLVG
jgi:hypothetical protein